MSFEYASYDMLFYAIFLIHFMVVELHALSPKAVILSSLKVWYFFLEIQGIMKLEM